MPRSLSDHGYAAAMSTYAVPVAPRVRETRSALQLAAHYILPVIAIILRLLSAPTADISYLVIAIHGVLGKLNVIESYFLLWLFNSLSEGIAPSPTSGAVDRYIVIFVVTCSVILRTIGSSLKSDTSASALETMVIGLLIAVHSVFVSAYAEISLLKVLLFSVVFCGLLVSWSQLSVIDSFRARGFVFYGLATILLVSMPFALGGVGYLRNGSGFQGILGHPQAFGPAMALLCAWSTARFLTVTQNPAWDILTSVLSLTAVYLTEARTAGLAVLLGIALPLLAEGRSKKSGLAASEAVKKARLIHLVVFSIFVTVAGGTLLSDGLASFLSKSGRSQSGNVLEAFQESRGGLIEPMIENIRSNPLLGIGFGIASDPSSMEIERDRYFGLPVAIAIEKGVLPLAVLEEVGLIGFVCLAAWAVSMVRRSKTKSLISGALLATTVFANFGESMFFSPGGMGMLFMIVVSLGVCGKVSDGRRI